MVEKIPKVMKGRIHPPGVSCVTTLGSKSRVSGRQKTQGWTQGQEVEQNSHFREL